MARIIPAEIYSGCPSPGEREIFTRLKNSPGIDGWVVLHSLDLATHIRQVSGEADFVIIAPELGVLCLEVKACTQLRRDEQGWWYGSNPMPDVRGPFRQASEAMHTIRKRISKARPDMANILCWSAVAFPYLAFNQQSPEWHEWQVIDAPRFRSRGFPDLVRVILGRAREYLESKGVVWFRGSDGRPTIAQTADLAAILRPSFELFASPKTRAQELESEVKHYTTEQYRALDAMTSNPRVLFMGPAGTGKTLLAIEAARRAAAGGYRTLFICFNRHLGQWLGDQMRSVAPRVKVSTLHRYMLDITEVPLKALPTTTFWTTELPAHALKVLLERVSLAEYDELIVDEAQDIVQPDYLDILDLSLQGGLAAGRWRLFGDFEKQSIYGQWPQHPLALLRERAGAVVEYALRENCRNPPRIACLAHLLGRLSPDYKKVLRPDNGVEPRIVYYSNADHQRQLLTKQLDALHNEGVQPNETVILSTRADQHSTAAMLTDGRWEIRPLTERNSRQVGYCSIHAFKGLEARVVIVIDVEDLGPIGASDLFYTGVTRPLERLVIFANEVVRTTLIHSLLGRTGQQ